MTVESGVAYGVQGADIHVFGDGMPVYLLENRKPPPMTDPAFLRELPSRMLNARFQVVGFTGRQEELGQLREWRDQESRLAVRWLHGPGGQGKTRLADQLALECTTLGWKAVTALHGPGAVWPSPGLQEDLRPGDAPGILLIIDYADQWPLSHLTFLFSNALLHHTIPTRILMLARSADWTALRATLANHQASTSTRQLSPLPEGPGGRPEAFAAARDAFAARYGLRNAAQLSSPSPLEGPEMGLTLTVHMAALVAVDARVGGRRPPRTPEGLTLYLLDREHLHWARLYGDGTHELDPDSRTFRTPPEAMERAVFAAALTGAVPRSSAIDVLDRLRLAPGAERVATDHVSCYPPSAPYRTTDQVHASALEPLYPDRLAEDFLALTLSGHRADYPARPWAAPVIEKVLERAADGFARPWTPRAVTFLAAAAAPDRWPHVAAHLNRVLRDDPALAVAAGSGALTALAGIPDMDVQVLGGIQLCLPTGPYPELAPGKAALVRRTTLHLLAATSDPAEQASLYSELALSVGEAGQHEEALTANEEAVRLRRRLAQEQEVHRPDLSRSLSHHAVFLSRTGRLDEALAASEEAVTTQRLLAAADPEHLRGLALLLSNLSGELEGLGRLEEARAAVEEAVEIRRRFTGTLDERRSYARSLSNLGMILGKLGRTRPSLERDMSAFLIHRELYGENPVASLPDVAASANSLGTHMFTFRWFDRAVFFGEAAVHFYRQLVRANRDMYEPYLADALTNLGVFLEKVDRGDEALTIAEESVDLYRSLVRTNRAAHEVELASALSNLGLRLWLQERVEEALKATREAVRIHERRARADWDASGEHYAMSLSNLGFQLAASGERQAALHTSGEAVLCYRRLADANEAFVPELGRALLAHAWTRLELREELTSGLSAAKESFALYRELAESLPEAFEAYLPVTLAMVAELLSALGRKAEEEAVRQFIDSGDFDAAASALS
ncbi:tetratricopeptide repeat protein [Streptomyces sp. NPDC021093]|uniref:tetratricopeptide repeat protein n=1 Tax=Streptomyces sp. NPDC021093 TaxID=3365112 RepID=UPI0037935198